MYVVRHLFMQDGDNCVKDVYTHNNKTLAIGYAATENRRAESGTAIHTVIDEDTGEAVYSRGWLNDALDLEPDGVSPSD